MLPYPDIKPYIIKIGAIEVRWYGLMYLLGFAASFLLVKAGIKKRGLSIKKEELENLYFYLMIGLILGARFGYVLFYNLPYYLENPLDIFAVWHGGMSFHGGLIGSLTAGLFYCVKIKTDFLALTDIVIPTIPIGLALGRLGNFINAELFGRPTSLPWGIVFPNGGKIPRHPSQLYEFILEGVLLFIILHFSKDRIKTRGAILPLFLVFYGAFRYFVEQYREPDPQLGLLFNYFTMGQILSTVMVIMGVLIYVLLRKKQRQRGIENLNRQRRKENA